MAQEREQRNIDPKPFFLEYKIDNSMLVSDYLQKYHHDQNKIEVNYKLEEFNLKLKRYNDENDNSTLKIGLFTESMHIGDVISKLVNHPHLNN